MSLATIPQSAVEIAEEPPHAGVRHVLFDLDGTLSLIRDGWQEHMVPVMLEALEACPRCEDREELLTNVLAFIHELTGGQAIEQFERLAAEVESRGGEPLEPHLYMTRFVDSLNLHTGDRLRQLEAGAAPPDGSLVPGARLFLDDLVGRGVLCHLASGTDIEIVRHDLHVLKLEHFFDDRVSGSPPDGTAFSKRRVMERLLANHDLDAPELLVVGDGRVEIEDARALGAVALGIHSLEDHRYHSSAGKRERLLRTGAHFLAPDLTEAMSILDYLQR